MQEENKLEIETLYVKKGAIFIEDIIMDEYYDEYGVVEKKLDNFIQVAQDHI